MKKWRVRAGNLRIGNKLRCTAPAPADLEEIGDFIARDCPASAARVVSGILCQCDVLCDHPQLERPGGVNW